MPHYPMIHPEAAHRYITRRRHDLKLAHTFFVSHQYDELERIGSKLAENALVFGFPELGTIGSRLEHACRARSEDDVATAIKKFKQWLEKASKASKAS